MKDLDEKIYELLEKTEKSLSVNEIMESITDSSKQEITRKLSEMKRQGIVYQKITQGKTYYSINSKDGEGRNASQENINNINKIFSAFGNKQAIDDFETFNNINSNILEDVGLLNKEKKDFIDFDINDLKYNKKISFENKMYKMEIPDSFKYLQEEEDRDFVAYLPKKGEFEELPYDAGGANIIIYPSTLIPFSDNKKRIAETKRMLYDIVFWNGGYIMFERFGGKPEYKAVELKSGRTGVIYMKFDSSHNFYFVSPVKEGFKQMRIVIEGINGTKEELEKIAISLMNKFEIKEELNDFKELNDKKYLTSNIDENIINDWVANIKGIQISVNEYFQIFAKLLSLKVTVLKSKDNFNIVKFKKEIREELDKYSSTIEKHIINGEEFINHLKKVNIEEKEKIPAYYCFKQFLTLKEFNINLEDGSTITKKVELADKVEKRLFDDEILKLISNYQDDDYNSDDSKEQVNEELNEYCEDFLKQSRKKLKRLRDDWEFTQDEYISGLNSKTIQSEYELKWELKNIKQAARNYGHQFDDFLTEIDIEGKKLLKQGANYLFIDSMKDIIDDVFDAFNDLHLSFTTSGTAFMDLGTFDYDIPDELEDIKSWWIKEYDNNPEVVKKREKAAKEREEKQKKEQAEKEKFLSELSSDLTEEEKKWDYETKEIKEELESEKKKLEKEYNSKKNKQLEDLENDKDEIVKDLGHKIDKLKKDNKTKENEISTLGILKFMQKDKLKNEIDINNQNIEKYNEQIANANTDYKKEKEKINNTIDEEYNKKISELEKTFKYPIEPEKVIEKISNLSSRISQRNDNYVTKTQQENQKTMEIIYETLLDLAKPVTIIDLMQYNKELAKCSNQKISALLKQMTDSRCVFRVVDRGKSYFAVGDGSLSSAFNSNGSTISSNNLNNELIDNNRKNSYSTARKDMYNLIKTVKVINPMENKIEELMNLSRLRIYQILLSLEEDGLINKKIENNMMIFNIK